MSIFDPTATTMSPSTARLEPWLEQMSPPLPAHQHRSIQDESADYAEPVTAPFPRLPYMQELGDRFDRLLTQLGTYSQPDPARRQFTSCCPAHCDQNPSLSIGLSDDGKLLATCHAGCTFEEIREALGNPPLDGYPSISTDGVVSFARSNELQIDDQLAKASLAKILDRVAGPPYTNALGAAEDWSGHLKRLQSQSVPSALTDIAKDLGVEASVLRSLGVICDSEGMLSYPEFDGNGCVCGVATRKPTGEKRMVTGSHRGIYISTALRELSGRWGWKDKYHHTHSERPTHVGWVEGNKDVYLLSDAAHQAVLRMAQEQNETFPWSSKTLNKRLRDRGLLKSVDEGRDHISVRKLFGEQRYYVLHFAAETVAPSVFEPNLAIPTE